MVNNGELQEEMNKINERIKKLSARWEEKENVATKKFPPQEQAKRRTERAVQGADLLWERLREPRQTTPWHPEWGLDREAIERAQGGRSKLLDTVEGSN